jgi:hypothetical protein
MPDGAILLSDQYNVAAMMELKSEGSPSAGTKHDEYKCILMTAVSIMALDEACKRAERDDPYQQATDGGVAGATGTDGRAVEEKFDHGLAIPFIIGKGSLASLYVMRLTNEGPIPVVQRLLQVKLDGNEYIMTRFIAVLAILLFDIFDH